MSCICLLCVLRGFKGILLLRALGSGRTPIAQSRIRSVHPVAGRDHTCRDSRSTPAGRTPPGLSFLLSPLRRARSVSGCWGHVSFGKPPPADVTSRVHSCEVTPCFPDVTPRLSARPGPKANLDAPLGAGCSSRDVKAGRRPHGPGRTAAPDSGSPFPPPPPRAPWGPEGAAGREERPQQTRAARPRGAATCVGVGRAGERRRKGSGRGPSGAHGAPAGTRPVSVGRGRALRGKTSAQRRVGLAGEHRRSAPAQPPHPEAPSGRGLRQGSVKRWKPANKPLCFLLL